MKSTKNKTFRIQQRNQHLKNILEESYYIELGTVNTQVMEKIMLGEEVKLEDIYHAGLLTEGIGRMTNNSPKEVKYQFAVLNSLRSKSATNKIFLTCGLLHYHLNDETEYYAPIVLIPVEIDFNEETIIKCWKNHNRQKTDIFIFNVCFLFTDIQIRQFMLKNIIFSLHLSTTNLILSIEPMFPGLILNLSTPDSIEARANL